MRSSHIILAFSILLGGCAFEAENIIEDIAPGESNTVSWIKIDGNIPYGTAEQLALKVVKNYGKTVTAGDFTAKMVSEDPPFSVVSVENKAPSGEDKYIRTLYRFNEDTIVAKSYPEYIEPPVSGANRQAREQYAREIALQARDGVAPVLPVMYEGKYAYSPKYDGGCIVTVTEKNSSFKVIGNYTVDVCK